ncbi:MAG: hypothetical protein ABGX07_09315 [Pirellulaceae bacterium]
MADNPLTHLGFVLVFGLRPAGELDTATNPLPLYLRLDWIAQ